MPGHIQYSTTTKLRQPVTYRLRTIRILFDCQSVGANEKLKIAN